MPIRPLLSLSSLITRHFSTNPPKLQNIPTQYRRKAIEAAKIALTEYLHSTRSLPFTYAEHISNNSPLSLSDVVSNTHYSSLSAFPNSIRKFLRYHPVNEFEFFYESIGISYYDLNDFLDKKKFFISEDSRGFNVACALSGFGFPWNLLGKLYKEEISIFGKDPDEIREILCEIRELGFNRVTVIGICLVFPFVIGRDPKLRGEIDGLFIDLRKLFFDFELARFIEKNVESWLGVCRKIRFFYDLGCEKGKIGELMGKNKRIFLEYEEDVFVFTSEFFSRLSVDKEKVGLLLLDRPEIFAIDLKNPVISVSKILNHLGLDEMELKFIAEKYPYVLGRNKMSNLPEVMRALNLQDWFFDQMRTTDNFPLNNYIISSCDEDIANDYKDFLDKIKFSRLPVHTLGKLNFLHAIGFGENNLTIAILKHLHGTSKDLQERFDGLLHAGLQFSKICRIINLSPKILNQRRETLEKKIKFLVENTGFSLGYLDDFPAFLCFDLEKRIKPRHKFHLWIIEKGLSAKRYSLASMIATSEKNFIFRIYGIHPAAVKHWFECFSM